VIMEFLGKHRIFASGDLDEGAEFAGQVWERNRSVKVDDLRYGIRWNQLDIGKLGFSYIEHDCAVDLTAEGPLSDHFRLFLHEDGSIRHRVAGNMFHSHPGNAVIHAPGSDLHLDISPFKLLLLTVDDDLVKSSVEQRFRKLPEYSKWLNVLPDSGRVQTLRSMAKWMAGEVERPGSPVAEAGKSRLYAERLLVSLVVDCICEASPETSEPAQNVSHSQVHSAEEWIDAHLTDAVTIEEIAAASGVGVRSLQLSFKRIHGCSPHEFLARRRLEEARRKLLAASPGVTVTEVAMDLGFFELGRFSTRYRRHFGETPSATLAQGEGRALSH